MKKQSSPAGEKKVIKLSEIMIDPKYATRDTRASKIHRIEELIALGEYPDPMLVCAVNGKYLLLGGFNRYYSWLRAFAGDLQQQVEVIVIPAESHTERIDAAIEDNIGQGDNYTLDELKKLYYRLRHEEGYSARHAAQVLRLTDDRTQRWEDIEIVKMEATEEESEPENLSQPGWESEPRNKSQPSSPSEPRCLSTPRDEERAVSPEPPDAESEPDCARQPEGRSEPEIKSTPNATERFPLINFHLNKLREHIPLTWANARAALDMLAEAINRDLKETNDERHD